MLGTFCLLTFSGKLESVECIFIFFFFPLCQQVLTCNVDGLQMRNMYLMTSYYFLGAGIS